MRKLLVNTITFLLLSGTVFTTSSFGQQPPVRYNVRALGMGNAFTADASGVSALYYNPAMLGKTGFHLELLSARLNGNDKLRDVVKFVRNNKDKFQNFESLSPEEAQQFLNDMEPLDDRYYGFQVAPSIGITFGHFGIASYAEASPNIKLDKGIYIPRIYTKGKVDWVTSIGYGKRFNIPALNNFYGGAAVKYIQRYNAPEMKVNATDASQIDQLGQTILDTLQSPVSGFAVDLGAVYSPIRNLDVAMAIQNIGSIDGESFTPNVNIGAAYNFSTIAMLPLIHNLTVTGDYTDFFNHESAAFFNHLHLGAEFGFLNFALRAGINQGYYTAGVGINLAIIHLDYAYYGQELGQAPGWKPDLNHMLQLKIGW